MYRIIKSGRFGNNIIQLINCIDLALQTGVRNIHHTFDFLSKSNIIIEENTSIKCERNECKYKKNKNISVTHCCKGCKLNGIHGPACQKEYIHIISSHFRTRNDIIKLYKKYDKSKNDPYITLTKYIKPILNYIQDDEYTPFYENSLFIHIRSGDIFGEFGKCVNHNYTQPPLDYYIKIFELEKNKRKFIFIEDNKNPVVNELKSLYPEINFLNISVKKLFGIFINAYYVVSGNGTFIQSILLFNSNLKLHYTTGGGGPTAGGRDFLYNCIDKEFPKTILAKFPNYIDEWKNTPEQRKLMIDYKGTLL